MGKVNYFAYAAEVIILFCSRNKHTYYSESGSVFDILILRGKMRQEFGLLFFFEARLWERWAVGHFHFWVFGYLYLFVVVFLLLLVQLLAKPRKTWEIRQVFLKVVEDGSLENINTIRSICE